MNYIYTLWLELQQPNKKHTFNKQQIIPVKNLYLNYLLYKNSFCEIPFICRKNTLQKLTITFISTSPIVIVHNTTQRYRN